ncbi:MAG: hypothetical protein ACYCSO_04775 [Cuniculiplasma sp.]
MSHRIIYAVASIIMAVIIAFILKDAYYVVISAIPLAVFSKKWATIYGLLIGFLSFISVYLQYPFSSIEKIGTIVGSIIGLPSLMIILIYPLLAGLISAFAALLWTSLYEMSNLKGKKKLVKIKS